MKSGRFNKGTQRLRRQVHAVEILKDSVSSRGKPVLVENTTPVDRCDRERGGRAYAARINARLTGAYRDRRGPRIRWASTAPLILIKWESVPEYTRRSLGVGIQTPDEVSGRDNPFPE